MRTFRTLSVAALLGTAQALRGSAANPLGRVLGLMDDLAAKITKEGEAEAKAYKEFFEWCDDAAKNKEFEIKTATSSKAKLEAAIGKSTAEIDEASMKIEELAGSLATAEADLENATTIRKKEAADFQSSEKELMETVDTIGRAISTLEREMAKNPASFAQMDVSSVQSIVASLSTIVDAAGFPSADKKKLMAFMQSKQASEEEDEELSAPAAAAYKSHSGGIVDILEDLKEKAEDDLAALRNAETGSVHNYQMLKQSLDDQIAAENKEMADNKAAKAAASEAKAKAEGDLANTVKELDDATKGLSKVKADCMNTAANHEATVNSRTEELKVIAEAKQIIKESTSGAVSQTYSLLQTASGSRLQTRLDLVNAEVLTAVRNLAKRHRSAALQQLVSRITSVLRLGATMGEDPFAKVKSLINDLIAKLEKEAGAEAQEKAYCDEQMAKTEEKKSELEEDTSKLAAKIDKAEARSAELKAEVKQLQDELAILAKEQAELDKIRQEESADYTQAKSDLEQGLAGVRKALGVLREYYGGAAALVQESQPAMPESHSKASGAGSSIIGILEVCESDFAKNLAKEEAEEEDSASAYDETTQENKITKTTKTQDVTYKTKEYNGLDKEIAELIGDKDTMDAELKAVLEYYAKIKDRCIAKPESYEERASRREDEIKGLKEALAILQDEAALIQKKGSSRHQYLHLDE